MEDGLKSVILIQIVRVFMDQQETANASQTLLVHHTVKDSSEIMLHIGTKPKLIGLIYNHSLNTLFKIAIGIKH